MRALTHACRAAKETLLGDADATAAPIVDRRPRLEADRRHAPHRAHARGGRRARRRRLLPAGRGRGAPAARARAGLTQLGLPYAQDAGGHAPPRGLPRPPGGASRNWKASRDRASGRELPAPHRGALQRRRVQGATLLRERIARRRSTPGSRPTARAPARAARGRRPRSRGRARRGLLRLVRHGHGVRIRGGTARAYYVGVESAMPAVPGLEPPMQALCVAPFGMEEGTEAELPRAGARRSSSASRCASASSARRCAARTASAPCSTPGSPTSSRSSRRSRPRCRPRAAPGEVVPVNLHAAVTEVGTLELEAVPRSGGERWKLEFNVRGERRQAATA